MVLLLVVVVVVMKKKGAYHVHRFYYSPTVLCKLVGTLKLYKHPTVTTTCYTVVIIVVLY